MPNFGEESLKEYKTLDFRIQAVLAIAILTYDFKILEGKRSEARQKENVRKKVSKTLNSKHVYPLGTPSLAVDIAPFPVLWPSNELSNEENAYRLKRFHTLAAYCLGIAHAKGIKMVSGMDWDGDWDFKDQSFHDLPHLQLEV